MVPCFFPFESIYGLRSEIRKCQLPHIHERKSRTFAVVGSWRNAPTISVEQRSMEPRYWSRTRIRMMEIVPSQRSCQPRQERKSTLLDELVVIESDPRPIADAMI
jgi:hypothetical protein